MTAVSVLPPYPAFPDIDGTPLENGYIFIGEPGLDPQSYPQTVYWDAALTVTAAQPIRTINGFPARSGTPATMYTDGNYSVRVLNSANTLVYSAAFSTFRYEDTQITSLENIAALRLNVAAYSVVYVRGYYSDADGGEGDFVLKESDTTSADNGGTVIVDAAGHRYWRQNEGEGYTVLQFGAVGDGVTDSLSYIQTALDTVSTVVIPNGYSFALSDSISIAQDNFTLSGEGELRFTNFTTSTGAIVVSGDYFTASGVYATNPNYIGGFTSAGVPTYGTGSQPAAPCFAISANNSYVTGCRVYGFNLCITVQPGDFNNHRIHSNEVWVLGTGPGPSNTTDAGGENCGDGITIWGASATVSGNIVTAIDGTDARCGIFGEWLVGHGTTDNSQIVITNNVVNGPFRRCADVERFQNFTISDNAFTGGNWGSIQVSGGASYGSISGNAIKYTRAADNWTGQAYSPWRCGINVYSGTSNVTITGNTLEISGYGDGIKINGSAVVVNGTISGNLVNYPTATAMDPHGTALELFSCSDFTVSGNTFVNSSILPPFGGLPTNYNTYGVAAFSSSGTFLTNNIIKVLTAGGTGIARGVDMTSCSNGAIITNNQIDAAFGLAQDGLNYISFQGNRLFNCSTGSADFFGSSNSICANNMLGGAPNPVNITNGVNGCVLVNNVA